MTPNAARAVAIASIVGIAISSLVGREAQAQGVLVLVRDSTEMPVSYANVQPVNGVRRVADVEGRAQFAVSRADSLRFAVRRLGFQPFIGWVRREGDSTYRVTLAPAASKAREVRVVATRDTPLARTGFYERIDRARRGAYSARFFTPEELDLRNPADITQLLQGENMVRPLVFTQNGRRQIVLAGRGVKCAMTILLDGRRVTGTLEEMIEDPRKNPSGLIAVDDLVPASSVAAIELYGSVAMAPVELQRAAGGVGCGIVAIWTGSRQ